MMPHCLSVHEGGTALSLHLSAWLPSRHLMERACVLSEGLGPASQISLPSMGIVSFYYPGERRPLAINPKVLGESSG